MALEQPVLSRLEEPPRRGQPFVNNVTLLTVNPARYELRATLVVLRIQVSQILWLTEKGLIPALSSPESAHPPKLVPTDKYDLSRYLGFIG